VHSSREAALLRRNGVLLPFVAGNIHGVDGAHINNRLAR
jgi:hypothetical protein